jgi:hypothetical protein
MKKSYLFLVLILICLPISHVFAEEEESLIKEQLSAYKSVISIDDLDLKVTNLIELPLYDVSKKYNDFVVFEVETRSFKPSYLNIVEEDIPFNISSKPEKSNIKNLVDNDKKTFVEYSLIDDDFSTSEITIEAKNSIRSSSLLINLDRYVSLPTFIEISTFDNEKKIIVFRKKDIKTHLNLDLSATLPHKAD